MYNHILVPLDTTPADETILRHIRLLANMTQARLTLLHVSDGFMARNQGRLVESDEMRDDRDYLERRRDELQREGFSTSAILACGEPAVHILAVAEQEGCDLIAMSTHGHRFFKDIILGSVAEAVRHRTSIPVLMIRAGESKKVQP